MLGLAPDGAALGDIPDGYRDYLREVRRYPDIPPAYDLVRGTAAASVDGTSYQEWARLAQAVAESLGVGRGDRLLVAAAEHEQPVTWLLAPLVAGASVVLCANLDPAAVPGRVAAERVTRVL